MYTTTRNSILHFPFCFCFPRFQISRIERTCRESGTSMRSRADSWVVTALHLGLGELTRARANRRYDESVEHEKDKLGTETTRCVRPWERRRGTERRNERHREYCVISDARSDLIYKVLPTRRRIVSPLGFSPNFDIHASRKCLVSPSPLFFDFPFFHVNFCPRGSYDSSVVFFWNTSILDGCGCQSVCTIRERS